MKGLNTLTSLINALYSLRKVKEVVNKPEVEGNL